jgi:hypothetical protein
VRWSEHPRGERASVVLSWAVIALAGLAISVVRPAAAGRFHQLRVTADVYPLPPPQQMVVASLGYRAALADAIFAHVLVSYGLHFQEKRRFEFVGDYLDTVNALDPTFRDPYRYADALLVLSPEKPKLEHYVKAREVLLRGLEANKYDTELWLTAGQYLAYLAPPYLPDDETKKAWRIEGAGILARACELVSKNENIPYHCITAAKLLDAAGEREAAIKSLKRLLAVTDDPEIVRMSEGYLGRLQDERDRERQQHRREAFRAAWMADLPFVSKDQMLVLGPRVDTARCAGPGHHEDAECVTTWRAWAGHADPTSE